METWTSRLRNHRISRGNFGIRMNGPNEYRETYHLAGTNFGNDF